MIRGRDSEYGGNGNCNFNYFYTCGCGNTLMYGKMFLPARSGEGYERRSRENNAYKSVRSYSYSYCRDFDSCHHLQVLRRKDMDEFYSVDEKYKSNQVVKISKKEL